MSEIQTVQVCGCCGGEMPPADVWEANRDRCTEECSGSVDARTGRCRAWADDELWAMPEE